MDVIAFAFSLTGSGIIAAFLLLVGYKMLFPGAKENTRRWAKGIGFVFALIFVAAAVGIPLLSSENAPVNQTAGSYEVTASDSKAYETCDNDANKVVVAVDFDYTNNTFHSSTSAIVVQFDIQRGLGTVGLVQTYADVTSIPSVTGSDGVAHSILSKTNDQYDATWNRSDGSTANKMITVNIAEDDDGSIVTLSMTLSASAVDAMQKYDTVDIGLTIAGQSWNVEVLLSATEGVYA